MILKILKMWLIGWGCDMKNLLYGVIRVSKGFIENNEINFFNFNGRGTNEEFMQRVLGIWDSLFSMSYIEYKKMLYELVKQNMESIGFHKLYYNLDDFYYELEKNQKSADNVFFYPIDSDDFVHNTLMRDIFPHINPELEIIRWNFYKYRNDVGSLDEYREQELMLDHVVSIDTNHYVIQLGNDASNLYHTSAAILWDSLQDDKKKHIDINLSLDNKNISSITNLYQSWKFPVPVKSPNEIVGYIGDTCMNAPNISKLDEWVRPHVQNIMDINELLFKSIKR